MKKPVIILSIALAIVVGILIGYVVIPKMHQQYVFPPPPTIPSEPSEQPTVIVEDSFVLGSHCSIDKLPREEAKELRQARGCGEGITYPFNKHGEYHNRFFLKRDEKVDVIVRSNIPINTNKLVDDLSVTVSYISLEGHWIGNSCGSAKRVNGSWEFHFNPYTAVQDGWYCLEITNYTNGEPWCQYVAMLKD